MATCGYICPSCDGRLYMEDGSPCPWCNPDDIQKKKKEIVSDEEWMNSVHYGDCCSHPENKQSQEGEDKK